MRRLKQPRLRRDPWKGLGLGGTLRSQAERINAERLVSCPHQEVKLGSWICDSHVRAEDLPGDINLVVFSM